MIKKLIMAMVISIFVVGLHGSDFDTGCKIDDDHTDYHANQSEKYEKPYVRAKQVLLADLLWKERSKQAEKREAALVAFIQAHTNARYTPVPFDQSPHQIPADLLVSNSYKIIVEKELSICESPNTIVRSLESN